MAQEENVLMCSGGSGGGSGSGCRSKKAKKIKVPQRGLGVAQLEKIRVEELKKANPFLAVQTPSFRPNISPSPNPLHFSPPQLLSSNALYRPLPSVINVESLLKPSNIGEVETGLDCAEQRILAESWNGVCNIEDDKQSINHQRFAFWAHLKKPYELNTISPLHSLPQKISQPRTPALVNVSSGILSSSQMEPPSNQSSYGNSCLPFSSEGDKMAGMKRSFPFSLETQPTPSSLYEFYPSYAADTSITSNGDRIQMEQRKECTRYEWNPREEIEENARPNRDFLTLAPPNAAPMESKPKNMHHLLEASGFEHLPCRGSTRNQVYATGLTGSPPEHLSSSFFPASLQSDQKNRHLNGSNSETIDLDLKL